MYDKGRRVEYSGWLPGMRFRYHLAEDYDAVTFDHCFEIWDH